jgi:hypothetical protein
MIKNWQKGAINESITLLMDLFLPETFNYTPLWGVSPDFSPTKFFAGQGAGREAVVSYCKCTATKQLRKNLLPRRVNF